MKLPVLLIVTAAMIGVSCERHEFDGEYGTRQLHEHHGHDDHGEHGDDHGKGDQQKTH